MSTTLLGPGRRVIGSERRAVAAKIKARYERGASIREIAEDIGRSYGFVHRMLGEAGAEMRGRGGGSRSGDAYTGG